MDRFTEMLRLHDVLDRVGEYYIRRIAVYGVHDARARRLSFRLAQLEAALEEIASPEEIELLEADPWD